MRVSGVRERLLETDLATDVSLVRLDVVRDGERRLLRDRDDLRFSSRVRCERLRSRERDRLALRDLDRRDRDVREALRRRDRDRLRRSRDLERFERERERLLRRERDRLRERERLRECECLERERDRFDLLRDRFDLVLERDLRLDRERCEREREARRSRERERDPERRRLSLANMPITGSIAAEIILWASFTIVIASSISAWAASLLFASGFEIESVAW